MTSTPGIRTPRGMGLSCAIALFAAAVASLPAPAHADVVFPPVGGNGGGDFLARCPQGDILTGFNLRTGDDVDAIGPICTPAYAGQFRDFPFMYGGSGGGPRQLVCPNDAPVVVRMLVKVEGVDTVIVDSLHLWCGVVATSQQLTELPNAVFDGAIAQHYGTMFTGHSLHRSESTQTCPAGMVAVGISGRSGIWLDAVGLLCDVPPAPPSPPAAAPPPSPSPPPPPTRKTFADTRTTTTMIQSRPVSASRIADAAAATPARRAALSSAVTATAIGGASTPATPATQVVAPPRLADGAQLWACASADAAMAGECDGDASAQAFCRARSAVGASGIRLADATPGIAVRAIDGDPCPDADACRVVASLQCDR